MDVKCSTCQAVLHCPIDFNAGDMVKCSNCQSTVAVAILLPSSTLGEKKFACPFCQQHYNCANEIVPEIMACSGCNYPFSLPIFPVPATLNTEVKATEVRVNNTPHQHQVQTFVQPYVLPQVQPQVVAVNHYVNVQPQEAPPAKKDSVLTYIFRVLFNVLWLLTGGFVSGIACFVYGGFCCITIIGIPIGLQLFKVGELCLSPFGADVFPKEKKPDQAVGCFLTFMNVIWVIFIGIWAALSSFISGLVLCCTIIGIPFGLQYFKLGKLVFAPFGLEVRRTTSVVPTYIAFILVSILSVVAFFANITNKVVEFDKTQKRLQQEYQDLKDKHENSNFDLKNKYSR